MFARIVSHVSVSWGGAHPTKGLFCGPGLLLGITRNEAQLRLVFMCGQHNFNLKPAAAILFNNHKPLFYNAVVAHSEWSSESPSPWNLVQMLFFDLDQGSTIDIFGHFWQISQHLQKLIRVAQTHFFSEIGKKRRVNETFKIFKFENTQVALVAVEQSDQHLPYVIPMGLMLLRLLNCHIVYAGMNLHCVCTRECSWMQGTAHKVTNWPMSWNMLHYVFVCDLPWKK